MNEIQFNLFVMDVVDVDFTNAAAAANDAAADCEFNADVADVSLWIAGFFFCIVKICLFFSYRIFFLYLGILVFLEKFLVCVFSSFLW